MNYIEAVANKKEANKKINAIKEFKSIVLETATDGEQMARTISYADAYEKIYTEQRDKFADICNKYRRIERLRKKAEELEYETHIAIEEDEEDNGNGEG